MSGREIKSSFNPADFISQIEIDKLLVKNKIFVDILDIYNEPCFFCEKVKKEGIRLNDQSFLCSVCLSKLSLISYPEKYQKSLELYLLQEESWKIARQNFIKMYEYTPQGFSFFPVLLLIPIFTIFPDIYFALSFLGIFLAYLYVASERDSKRLQEWNNLLKLWDLKHPKPLVPTNLKHFYDPEAILSKKDMKVIKVFNNWPGYPPFWDFLKKKIRERDDNRCQVSGCPSRVCLHVHHKIPTAKGGEHIPENLVTLCDFHHALEPDEGHQLIWEDIKNDYFSIVRGHSRINSNNMVSFVKEHLRRKILVNINDIKKIKNYYSLSCVECNSENLDITIDQKNVAILCFDCRNSFCIPKGVAEETGPFLAENLLIKKNKGSWCNRSETLGLRISNVKRMAKKTKKLKVVTKSKPSCPVCGSKMELKVPKENDSWKKFWGCTKYRTQKCKGSRPA